MYYIIKINFMTNLHDNEAEMSWAENPAIPLAFFDHIIQSVSKKKNSPFKYLTSDTTVLGRGN